MIKVHMEKTFGALDVLTAFSFTADYSDDAIHEDPYLPLHYEPRFDYDVNPALVAANDSKHDYLVETFDIIDTRPE